MSKDYLKIGQYIPATGNADAVIDREYFRQGYIVKDEESFDTDLYAVCYIPELSDTTYTRQSFIDLMDGQEALAKDLCGRVDWQHPETLLEEDYACGEYADCAECGRMFACHGRSDCPHCHAPYMEDD